MVSHQRVGTNISRLHHPLWLVGSSAAVLSPRILSQRKFVQADILDGRPDDRQATGLGREDINLIGALPHIAEETFDGIGRLNMAPLQDSAECIWL